MVVGSANIDLIAEVDRLPTAGETVLGADAVVQPGGKGANQAVAARRLGADTVLYAAVGADTFGDRVRENLAAEGIRTDRVATIAGATTGLAMIVVASEGENTIVVSPGANRMLDGATLDPLAAELSAGDVVVLQLEIPPEACLLAARVARTAGARVVLNAAPPPAADDPTVTELLALVDVLVVNETEALALAGYGAVADWPRLAAGLLGYGPVAAVVTLGGRGALVATATGVAAQPAIPVEVVDPTGAGDAFCGALAAALAAGRELSDAVRRGCAAGALATTRLGAQAALPTDVDLDRLLGDA